MSGGWVGHLTIGSIRTVHISYGAPMLSYSHPIRGYDTESIGRECVPTI